MSSVGTRFRLRVRVRGAVQGVGFRPFVNTLASRFDLTGWVLNDGDGVLAEVEGAATDQFLEALRNDAPPLSRIDDVESEEIEPVGETSFEIHMSQGGAVATSIPADAAVCDGCLDELFDPADRHYRYPFINCTHCGPRYTITRHLPYDRPQTSMADFVMCEDCAKEYKDPLDRRFHAQPVACPACGPKLSMDVAEIVQRLKSGEILAIKGLGGFHIVCDARNEDAVMRLRERKNREEKPLAVMGANIASLKAWADIDEQAECEVSLTPRPIVVLPKRPDNGLAPSIAPGLGEVGVLLPYTPIHYLLFHQDAGNPDGTAWLDQPQDLALVMTSANPGGEPLVIDNDEAVERLEGLADAIVSHDRDILIRTDDSVKRMIGGKATFIRRARGYVPEPVKLPNTVAPGIALGGHLKNTVCVTRGDEAFVSQHVGELNTPQSLTFFEETIDHLLSITDVTPQWVAHDLHPDFHSTRTALEMANAQSIPSIGVQHHHAHIAAVIAEHNLKGPVIGLALDGFGLGEGQGSHNWGGEALLAVGGNYTRLGHLADLPMPGGEAAFRAPWKIGAAVLHQLGRGDEIESRYGEFGDTALLAQVLERGINVVPSTSCGRLFDAAAGLLGVQPEASFEGQAPMKLEALVTKPKLYTRGWTTKNGTLDLSPLLDHIADLGEVEGANVFHGTLIEALSMWAQQLALVVNTNQVVLSGGCILNRVLAEGLDRRLGGLGLKVYRPHKLPPNDGGLSLGQAWVAVHKLAAS